MQKALINTGAILCYTPCSHQLLSLVPGTALFAAVTLLMTAFQQAKSDQCLAR